MNKTYEWRCFGLGFFILFILTAYLIETPAQDPPDTAHPMEGVWESSTTVPWSIRVEGNKIYWKEKLSEGWSEEISGTLSGNRAETKWPAQNYRCQNRRGQIEFPLRFTLSEDGKKLYIEQKMLDPQACSRGRLSWTGWMPFLVSSELSKNPCTDETVANAQAIRHQLELLETFRQFGDVMAAIRGHIRPTDLAEKALDEPGTGRLMREALSLGEKLTEELKVTPKFLKNVSESSKRIEQVRALADFPTRLAKAVKTAETSSGSEKLEDLEQLFNDAKTLVSIIVAVNPVIGAYLSVLNKAIQNIARDAKIIEEAVARTNWAIEQASATIGKTREIVYEPSDMDSAIFEIKQQIRESERKCDQAAYEEIEKAERPCFARFDLNVQSLANLRFQAMVRLPNLYSELQSALYGIKTGTIALRDQIEREQEHLRELKSSARSERDANRAYDILERKIPAQKERIKVLKNELGRFETVGPQKAAELNQNAEKVKREYDLKKVLLQEFDSCVREGLKEARYANVAYLTDKFPHYRQR